MSKYLYRWLATTPPVLWHPATPDDQIGKHLAGMNQPVLRLIFTTWYRSVESWVTFYAQAKRLRPQDTIRLLVNEDDITAELQRKGIPAYHINQNCMINEHEFTILGRSCQSYSAIYIARMAPFKRHELMEKIPRAMCLGGIVVPGEDSGEYFAKMLRTLPNVTFTHARNMQQDMPPSLVAQNINRACVGLCLSAEEGGMFACTEYLLCGLPVVTTTSYGGRDFWLDGSNSITVRPDSDAVAEAVRELASKGLKPQTIRADTLMKMQLHRRRLCDLGQQFYERMAAQTEFTRDFYRGFVGPHHHWHHPEEVMEIYRQTKRKTRV